MKTKFTLLIALLITLIGSAQQGINYKALIKDASENVIANQSITISFSILQGITQTNVYQETHNPTTDGNGIVVANIGEGTVVSGVFDTIDWGNDDYFLNVQINISNGFVDMGTTQFMAVPYALHAQNVSGLEKIEETGTLGWRLVGSNPDYFGNIGGGAVDLSNADGSASDYGATGLFSTAMGFNTRASGTYSIATGERSIASGSNATATGRFTLASGLYSTAIGNSSTASGTNSITIGFGSKAISDYSIALGRSTEASGVNGSTAMGYNTVASGNISTTMGSATTASGNISTAIGYITKASGNYSTAMGSNTKAEAYLSTAIGGFNIGGGDPNVNSPTNPLFEVGNGADDANRSNTLTVFGGSNAFLVNPTSGFVMIGNSSGANLLFDTNEIMARNNGSTANLTLQREGGNVIVGGVTVHVSDRRLKKDIQPLPYGLKEIVQLQPKAYNWKNREQEHKSLGLIAQEVQVIIKEVITTQDDENKTLGISYTELIPVLINAIKEQQVMIDNLQSKLENKNNASSNLSVRVNKIEKLLYQKNEVEVANNNK